MHRKRFFAAVLIVAAAAFASPPPARAQASPWIHVEVINSGDKAETVRVNVPLSLARVAVNVLPEKVTEKVSGKLAEGLEKHDMTLADLRTLWNELKRTGDAQFVSVESEDESVRVARAGDKVRVMVEDRKKDKGETVKVEIPIAVVDALLSGDGEELNIEAAVAKLGEQRGEIVNVTSDDENVRVWIDETS